MITSRRLLPETPRRAPPEEEEEEGGRQEPLCSPYAWMRRAVVGAETAGTGPDVTSVVAGVEAAITEAWEEVGTGRPSEDEGNFIKDRLKPAEDTASFSPYTLRLSMLKKQRKTWSKNGVTEKMDNKILEISLNERSHKSWTENIPLPTHPSFGKG